MPTRLGGEALIGHSGRSGAFAFLAPGAGVFLAGTVNNGAGPGSSFRLMQRLVRATRDGGA
jgi:hypothetical protein